ncbi:MAG TPA: ribosome maturation factor RimP [Actinomycetales bacterium]|nr:ribosome maturation factor RimP [Actinomycetales bacterium]
MQEEYMSRVPIERLRETVAAAVESVGLLLEDVTTTQAGRRSVVRVVVDLPDGPGGVTSDQLGDATRAVSDALDSDDPIPGTYTLEVTTPGIDRPLTEPRHFRRATGRLVRIETADGAREGRVTEATQDAVVLGEETVAYRDITRANMIVDFGRAEKE